MNHTFVVEAVIADARVDERNEDVSGARRCGQALVEVGQPARMDQHVTLCYIGDGAVIPSGKISCNGPPCISVFHERALHKR